MDKTKAVVWFTGVISKYNLSNDSLDDLKINYSLLEKLSSKYDLIFIICVPNEDVKLKYLSICFLQKDHHYYYLYKKKKKSVIISIINYSFFISYILY